MNLQIRTKTTGRFARALIVGGLAVAAAATMNGRDFIPGFATVAAQGPVLVVIAVPFAGRDGSAHVVYSGGSIVLQAVASIGGNGIPVTLTSATWDPGDGSGPQVITFTNSRVLELTHTYTGSDSTTFFATIAVNDGTTTATDTFKVQIVPRSLDAEVNMAVDRALWYNHRRMTIDVVSGPDGDHPAGWWNDDNANASTSAAVQAFEVNGHRESGDRLKNPYVDDTTRGLRFLEAHVQRFDISDLQGHAGTPEDPAPDTNGNGYGLQTDGGHVVYVGGQIIDAFVASGTPNAVVIAGSEAGRTYKDLAQDLLDAYSYGQYEDGHGGWVYDWNTNEGIDSSSSGWWGVGARAGDVWSLTIPAWVKTRNFTLGIQGTLQAFNGSNTGTDGSCGYRDASDVNTARTGACLIMMAADGVSSTHARYVAAENWLRRGFSSGGVDDAHGQIYDMYNVTKAMRLAVDGTGASAPITHLGGDIDWYGADPDPTVPSSHQNGFARYVVANQASDGKLGFGGWVSGATANSWGALILSTALFEQGPTAVCQADAIVCSAGATCGAATVGAFSTANFDGSQSVAGDNAVASYKWDFKDPTSATPTSTDVTTTHVFDSVGTYPVTLTVKDTKGNASTAICSVVVSIADLPPLASAGPSGGYAMCLGRSDQVVLDASASIARGADVVSYEWDIQAPTNFDAVSATGVTTNQTAYFTSLGVGSWPIKVRVTDNHTGPLVDEAGSTVTVRAHDDEACNRPPVAVADSASTFSGTPAVISVLPNDSDPDTWQVFTVSNTTTPASGTAVVNVDQTVTYTPNLGFAGTDTFNYTMSDGLDGSASALVTVTVTKRDATVTAGSGTKIYGAVDPTLTPTSSGFLSGITVTETARDAGENVGSYATHATAAGATLANYNVTYGAGSQSITQAATAITWSTPVDIFQGTPLGNTELSATASVPGTFAYTPSAGTMLLVGDDQTLSVTFTPTGSNYQSATETVSINVNVPPNLTLAASVASPQILGAQVTFNTTLSGAIGSYEYLFYMRNPLGTWTIVQSFSATTNWLWNTTGLTPGVYTLQVWTRRAGTTVSFDTWKGVDFTLVSPPPTSVTLNSSVSSPQTPGQQVTFTAAASGGGIYEYQFYQLNPQGVWTIVQAYSPTTTWTWNTTAGAPGRYTLQVWVRSAGTTVSYHTWNVLGFTLVLPATSVTLSSSGASPLSSGAPVTFSASASGGSGSYEYLFYLRNTQGSWSLVQPYGPSNGWTWNTTGWATGSYSLQVWARSAGTTASYDTWNTLTFTVVPAPATSVTLNSSVLSPQVSGTQVTFNASATGCGGSCEYLFYLLNPQGTWVLVQPYGLSSSWTWNTASGTTGTYSLQVWARNAGTTGSYDAWTGLRFTVNLASPQP